MNVRIAVSSILFVNALSGSAIASEPPLFTEKELLSQSDLVADVRVSATACDGEPWSDGYTSTQPYISTIEVLLAHKGEAEGTYPLYTTSNSLLGEEWGCWDEGAVFPGGWVGRMYLRNAGAGYRLVDDLSGAELDPARSVLEELPICEEPDSEGDPEDDPEDVGPEGPERVTASGEEAAGCSFAANSAPGKGGAFFGLLGLAFMAARRRSW